MQSRSPAVRRPTPGRSGGRTRSRFLAITPAADARPPMAGWSLEESGVVARFVLWLAIGLLPILVDSVPAVANAVGTVAAGSGPLAQPAVLLLHPTVVMTG